MKKLVCLTTLIIMCCMGSAFASTFVDNKNGSVSNGADLVWQKGSSPKLSWDDATKLCEELDLAGRSDWRIPTREELLKLVDRTRKDPAIDIKLFPETEPNVYWSSSRDGGEIWTVGFSDGDEFIFDSLDYKWHTRCVSENKVEPYTQSLMDWAAAWSKKDADAYIASYGPEYKGSKKSRKSWENERRKKIARPKWIQVTLSDIKMLSSKDDRVDVELVQSYKANRYADRTRKSFVLERVGGAWKIVEEKTLKKLK